MSQEVVATGKAFEFVAIREVAEEGVFVRRLLEVCFLMTDEIFGVCEARLAVVALVRSFRAIQMLLLVATRRSQSQAYHAEDMFAKELQNILEVVIAADRHGKSRRRQGIKLTSARMHD
jgi:hypothetical protein